MVTERKTRHILHVEERDLSSHGLLEALNAIAAHAEIFQYYQKDELEALVGNLRQLQGTLLVADLTNAQMMDQIRQAVKDDFSIII